MINNNSNNIKRSKKPKPLFGIFRKNKPDPVIVIPSSSTSAVPLGSVLNNYNSKNDPYSPPKLPKSVISDGRHQLLSPQFTSTTSKQQHILRRPRSKSVGRDPSNYNNNNSNHFRLMEERESALNKLCSREINSPSSSLSDSLPLLSPTYSPPPVPPIPLRHQQYTTSPRSPQQQPRSPLQQSQPRSPLQPQQQQMQRSPMSPQKPPMRKFSSAHDLRKAAKLQQDSIQQAQIKPLPIKKDLSRSRSLNNGQHYAKPPTTPNVMALSRPRWPPIRSERDDDDDDDIPLGYLQSPISPSSLLSDNEEEDDKDLVPIGILNHTEVLENDYQTAADKYKEKVKERLHIQDDDDDDNIPISLLSCNNKKSF